MALITPKQRDEAELLIYKVLDAVDPSHTNSDYYREIFSKMSDDQFYHFFQRRLPIRFHYEVFKIEPKMEEIIQGFKILKKPLIERVNLPYVYRRTDGTPVKSQECMVMYLHIKRMQQIVAKKSHVALNVEKRDMKTGLLVSEDKGSKETDREFESLASYGLDFTIDEFSRVRGDAMDASTEMNSIIAAKGSVSQNDFTVSKYDSLAKNTLNVYLIGSHIYTNLVDINYMTPHTAQNRERKVERL